MLSVRHCRGPGVVRRGSSSSNQNAVLWRWISIFLPRIFIRGSDQSKREFKCWLYWLYWAESLFRSHCPFPGSRAFLKTSVNSPERFKKIWNFEFCKQQAKPSRAFHTLPLDILRILRDRLLLAIFMLRKIGVLPIACSQPAAHQHICKPDDRLLGHSRVGQAIIFIDFKVK